MTIFGTHPLSEAAMAEDFRLVQIHPFGTSGGRVDQFFIRLPPEWSQKGRAGFELGFGPHRAPVGARRSGTREWRIIKRELPSLYSHLARNPGVLNADIWARAHDDGARLTRVELLGLASGVKLVQSWGNGLYAVVRGRRWGETEESVLAEASTVPGHRAFDAFCVDPSIAPADAGTRVTSWREILVRRGQPAFRQALLDAFDRRCCVTDCAVQDVLEAAHIAPHAAGGAAVVTNGLLLRADVHVLFDAGLLWVDASDGVRLASQVRASEPYVPLDGRKVRPPRAVDTVAWRHNLGEHRRWAVGV